MLCPEIRIEGPESLVVDFACNSESPTRGRSRASTIPLGRSTPSFGNFSKVYQLRRSKRLAQTRSSRVFTELMSVLRARGSPHDPLIHLSEFNCTQ